LDPGISKPSPTFFTHSCRHSTVPDEVTQHCGKGRVDVEVTLAIFRFRPFDELPVGAFPYLQR
jgi:hypothetical protein